MLYALHKVLVLLLKFNVLYSDRIPKNTQVIANHKLTGKELKPMRSDDLMCVFFFFWHLLYRSLPRLLSFNVS